MERSIMYKYFLNCFSQKEDYNDYFETIHRDGFPKRIDSVYVPIQSDHRRRIHW